MNVLVRKRLSRVRGEQAGALWEKVKETEGGLVPAFCVEDNFAFLPHFFLGYEKGELEAYAECFFPAGRSAEIMLFVQSNGRPLEWTQAILKKLEAVFLKYPQLSGIRCEFVCTPQSKALREALRELGKRKVRSEYLLELRPHHENRKNLPDEILPVWKEEGGAKELTLFHAEEEAAHGRLFLDEGRAFLFDVWVKPSHRRQGLGSYLVSELFKSAGQRPVLLHVFGKTSAAMRLYRRIGCAVLEQRDYFS